MSSGPPSDGTVASRALHIWDSDDGLAIFENRGEKVAIDPMDPSTLFLLFTKILPRPTSCSTSPPSAPVRILWPKGGEGSPLTSGSVGSPRGPDGS